MSQSNAQRNEEPQLEWQSEYRSMLMETDPAKLKDKIERTELAMFLRAQELKTPDTDPERQAMRDAANALRVLLDTVLKYPSLRK